MNKKEKISLSPLLLFFHFITMIAIGVVNENIASEEGSHPTRHSKTLIIL